MSEAIKLTIVNTGVFDGVSPINLTRANLGEPNAYSASINGGGVIDASIFGLMAAKTAKLVSIAAETDGYPGAIARVSSPSNPDDPREEVILQGAYQRMLMAGGEVLRINWSGDPTRNRLVSIIIQDLAERECTPIMRVEHRPEPRMQRFHIYVDAGGLQPGSTGFAPTWTWDPSLRIYTVSLAAGTGHLTLGNLTNACTFGKGAYVWAKFSGSAASDLGTMNWRTNQVYKVATGLPPDMWSKPVWISVTDRLVFEAPAPALGGSVSVDLDVSPLMLRRLTGAS